MKMRTECYKRAYCPSRLGADCSSQESEPKSANDVSFIHDPLFTNIDVLCANHQSHKCQVSSRYGHRPSLQRSLKAGDNGASNLLCIHRFQTALRESLYKSVQAVQALNGLYFLSRIWVTTI